jgi:hypothetical protein
MLLEVGDLAERLASLEAVIGLRLEEQVQGKRK